MDTLTYAYEDTRFLEPVAIIIEDEPAILAMLPHHVVAAWMGPDPDEALDGCEA